MKKIIILIIIVLLSVSVFTGCGNSNKTNWVLAEISLPSNREAITNQIPEWVMASNNNSTPLYAVTNVNIDDVVDYAKTNFPEISDANWTQEQSDNLSLGFGIRVFRLDNQNYDLVELYYFPILLNGTIVSMLMVIRDDNDLRIQVNPNFVNQLNYLASKTSNEIPLYLGVNHYNLIAVVGDEVFVLVPDYDTHAEIKVSEINIEKLTGTVVTSTKEIITSERTANVDDWNTVPN